MGRLGAPHVRPVRDGEQAPAWVGDPVCMCDHGFRTHARGFHPDYPGKCLVCTCKTFQASGRVRKRHVRRTPG